MVKVTIVHQFDSYEESEEIERFLSSRKALDVLEEVDQDIRGKLKYSDDEWLETEASDYLEEIRKKIWESGVLDG